MSRYTVDVTTAAAREIRKLDRSLRDRELATLAQLEVNPRPVAVRKLVGFDNAWRVRVGRHRILYEIDDHVLVVTVFRAAHRRGVYEC